MILAFHIGPAASGRGLCDIDRLLFKVAKIEKSLYYGNILLGVPDVTYNRYIFAVLELPNSLTRDLVTPNNTLSMSYSPHPLAAGPIRNAENMESLLFITLRLGHIRCSFSSIMFYLGSHHVPKA